MVFTAASWWSTDKQAFSPLTDGCFFPSLFSSVTQLDANFCVAQLRKPNRRRTNKHLTALRLNPHQWCWSKKVLSCSSLPGWTHPNPQVADASLSSGRVQISLHLICGLIYVYLATCVCSERRSHRRSSQETWRLGTMRSVLLSLSPYLANHWRCSRRFSASRCPLKVLCVELNGSKEPIATSDVPLGGTNSLNLLWCQSENCKTFC